MSRYTVILSASRANHDIATNIYMSSAFCHRAAVAGFKNPLPVLGSYREEGQAVAAIEQSFMFTDLSFDAVKQLTWLACVPYQQDCVLVINQNTNEAALWDCQAAKPELYRSSEDAAPMVILGEWQKVSEEEALAAVAYTQSGLNYWMAK